MNKTRRIVIISIFCCLSVVLDIIKEFIPFLNLPSGGSINISLIPIFVCGFCFGIKEGLACSFLSFLLSSLLGLNSYIISIPQYILDYIVPFICVGLGSAFYKNKKLWQMEIGILLAMFLRTLSIIISGAYYWIESTMLAGSKEAIIFSITYNVPYALLTTILLMITVPLINKMLRKYLV